MKLILENWRGYLNKVLTENSQCDEKNSSKITKVFNRAIIRATLLSPNRVFNVGRGEIIDGQVVARVYPVPVMQEFFPRSAYEALDDSRVTSVLRACGTIELQQLDGLWYFVYTPAGESPSREGAAAEAVESEEGSCSNLHIEDTTYGIPNIRRLFAAASRALVVKVKSSSGKPMATKLWRFSPPQFMTHPIFQSRMWIVKGVSKGSHFSKFKKEAFNKIKNMIEEAQLPAVAKLKRCAKVREASGELKVMLWKGTLYITYEEWLDRQPSPRKQ